MLISIFSGEVRLLSEKLCSTPEIRLEQISEQSCVIWFSREACSELTGLICDVVAKQIEYDFAGSVIVDTTNWRFGRIALSKNPVTSVAKNELKNAILQVVTMLKKTAHACKDFDPKYAQKIGAAQLKNFGPGPS